MPPPSTPSPAPDHLTWAYLLARWTDFARASVAFPDDGLGSRWKAIVPDIIALQAISHALADAHLLPGDEHALALERADLAIRTHSANIHNAWRGVPLAGSLAELIADARHAHRIASALGLVANATRDHLLMPDLTPLIGALLESNWHGTIRAALPATILYAGEPALFLTPPAALPGPALHHIANLSGIALAPAPTVPMQIYRQSDPATARITADLIAPFLTELPPGRPILRTLIELGEPTDVMREHDPQRWLNAQRAAGLDGVFVPPIHIDAEIQP